MKKDKKDQVLFWIVTEASVPGQENRRRLTASRISAFFCVDNLPVALLPKMAELCFQSGRPLQRVALGIDIREGGFLRDFLSTVEQLKKQGVDCKIVFLDADDRALLRRFSETRRRHPLGTSVRQMALKKNRQTALKIKELADKIVDTTNFTLSELKQRILELLEPSDAHSDMQLSAVLLRIQIRPARRLGSGLGCPLHAKPQLQTEPTRKKWTRCRGAPLRDADAASQALQ